MSYIANLEASYIEFAQENLAKGHSKELLRKATHVARWVVFALALGGVAVLAAIAPVWVTVAGAALGTWYMHGIHTGTAAIRTFLSQLEEDEDA